MRVDSNVSIRARIASHAAVAPGRLAVADTAVRLTYAELERRSARLAALLRESGAGPERCVGLYLERSVDFVVAALGVLKSGAAYLPLDPATPPDRAAFILADSGAALLLTHRQKARALAPGPWLVVDLEDLHVEASPKQMGLGDADEPALDSLAYVIYTSGSTGRPKGVEITHANLLNLIEWHQGAFGVTEADRASQLAGLGFDAVGWEIWPHLTAGASLHIPDEFTRRSPHALRDWLVAERISISFVPTVLAEQLLHATWPAGTALRTLLTGADTLHRRPAPGLPFALVNNYGPTECTVVATSGTVSPTGAGGVLGGTVGPPSIGRPIANATAIILDGSLRPVAPGEAGELCLAGALVGRGYRNHPELTATCFVTFTPASGPPVRIYRTGDRARLLESGEIAFLGRHDDQVKVRGYRIELGEIVACLDRCPGVEASAVMVRDPAGNNGSAGNNGPGGHGPALVAYVVAAPDARLTASDLREFLAARLHDYMIPAHFVTIPALPTTDNGKLDKSALPAPHPDNLVPNRVPVAAATGTAECRGESAVFEQRISDMVAALLGQASIERDDDFFMVGGHSMLGAQLVARIRDTFGVKLSLRQLFGAPTVATLSAEVTRLTGPATNGAAAGGFRERGR